MKAFSLVGRCAQLLAAVLLLPLVQSKQDVLSTETQDRPPNIVFIITDDQDLHLSSIEYQPLLKKHLLDQGTFYSRHYCTVALCCPSRVSLLTGKAAHNTNVTDVMPPYGGYPKFLARGLNDDYLPLWLQQAGYNTYYTGKLFNAHTVANYKSFPKGFNGTDFLLDPFTYQYLNPTFQHNEDPPVNHKGEYSTDLVAAKALAFLDEAAGKSRPFFVGVAPIGPHANVEVIGDQLGVSELSDASFSAPIPAARHAHLFSDAMVPRSSSFNPESPSGGSWVRHLPRQDEANVEYNDHYYRSRLRALQAVDELVEGVVKRLEDLDLLDDTYIFYTSDNGYHIGQHRLQPGKTCGYEEDINVPLVVRGPGVPRNLTTDIVTTHTDLAPTLLSRIAGFPLRPEFDGEAIPLTAESIEDAATQRHEHVNVEYWGFWLAEGDFDFPGGKMGYNNTYKALRVAGEDYNFYYSVWCNNERELYEMNSDPHQMKNLLQEDHERQWPSVLGYPLSKVVSRLDALLFVLKSCKGRQCVQPWKSLHPDGDVRDLRRALHPVFDAFYEQKSPRIAFDRCEPGYLLDAEGPQFESVGLAFRNGQAWHEWV